MPRWHSLALGNPQEISAIYLEIVNAEIINRVRHAREHAQAARKFAEQCKQRAARLILEAGLLLERFDELEEKVMLKTRFLPVSKTKAHQQSQKDEQRL